MLPRFQLEHQCLGQECCRLLEAAEKEVSRSFLCLGLVVSRSVMPGELSYYYYYYYYYYYHHYYYYYYYYYYYLKEERVASTYEAKKCQSPPGIEPGTCGLHDQCSTA